MYCLLKALKMSASEGETCVSAAEHHGATTLEHTGSDGQQELHQLMTAARDDWTKAVDELREVAASLEARLLRWTEFDRYCEELSTWLMETEVQLKSVEMKCTVADKQAVVTQLCVSFFAVLYMISIFFVMR